MVYLWKIVVIESAIQVLAFTCILILFMKKSPWFSPETKYWGLVLSGYMFIPVFFFVLPIAFFTNRTFDFRVDIFVYSCTACVFGLALAALRIDISPKIGAITLLTLSGLVLSFFLIALIGAFFR